MCNTCKALYKPPIVAHKAEKSLNFHVGLEQCTFCNGFQIQIAGPHTFLGDPVHQVADVFLEKVALQQLKCRIILPEPVEDHMQSVEMFLCYLQEYDYVVSVDEAINEV